MIDRNDLKITHDRVARAVYIRLVPDRAYPGAGHHTLETEAFKALKDGFAIHIDKVKGSSKVVGIEILY